MKVKSIEETEAAVARIGELQTERTRIELVAKEAVKKIESKVPGLVGPIDVELEELTNAIKEYVVKNRSELFEKDSKTIRLATGDIFIRKDPHSIEGSITAKKIDELLARYKLKGRVGALEDELRGIYLKLKISADRELMLKSPADATERVGVTVATGVEKLHIAPHTVNAPPTA